MLSENLWPVCLTTGVCPMGAQVVPAWKSERIPDSSAKKSQLPPGWPANLRILAFYPLLDQRGVLLKRFSQRSLATQSQLRQKPTYRSQAQLNAILPPDQRADHHSSPQCKRKLQVQRVLNRHGPINPLKLWPPQFVRPSLKLPGLERPQPPDRYAASQL